jgi:3-oxochol-4-en-24-oyl-CoA dehydrogenase
LPIAITDEQLALRASIREWAKRTAAIETVRGLEPPGASDPASEAADPADLNWRAAALRPAEYGIATVAGAGPAAERWSGLADIGVFAIGLPPGSGGPGGTTADLAAALAALTESLVPGPVLPTLLARLALTAGQAQPAARDLLPRIAAGEVSVATALDDGAVTGTWQPDGSLRLTGTCGPVLGAGSTTHLLVPATIRAGTGPALTGESRWLLLPADRTGVTITWHAPADFSRALADVSLDAVTATPDDQLAGVGTGQLRDLAAVLFCTEAASVAGWCARTAAEYAAIRHQFGRPIGSFQAVKHLCAGLLVRTETASVLAWDAARTIDEAPAELPVAAATAAAYALDAAVDCAKDCIQVLGGIGFTWEHDAHLYLRRAIALRQLLGGSAAWRDRAAELALCGARRHLVLLDDPAGESAELTQLRHATQALAAGWAALPEAGRRQAMARAGYAEPGWPEPYGLAASPAARLVIDAELGRAGLARPDIGIGAWAVPAILRHGGSEQAERFAGPTLRGEISWCQLFSEPEAGSDLASLRTRAERADGGWLITGQKVWTSLARQAEWGICLARTDPAVPKHKGITFFLVRMDSPGIDIRPLRELTGRQMFNQVFLDGVYVPDDCVVGRAGEGWAVARTTLASERLAIGAGSSVGAAVEDLLALALRLGTAGDPVFRQRLGALIAEGTAVSLLDLQAVLARLRGTDQGPLAAVGKLVGVQHRQAAAEAALELSGPAGAAAGADTAALLHEFLVTRCLSIAGGTTQILLSMVGERLLGLPREEAR